MRPFSPSRNLFMVVFALALPLVGAAQVFYQPTPAPLVTAASEAWQVNGEPVFSDGIAFYPAGPTVFFDGNIMVRTGVYRGIPLYQDRTIEPHSIVFVPLTSSIMRPYERRRAGELAGTSGSRTPSFPVQTASPTASGGIPAEDAAAAFPEAGSIGTAGLRPAMVPVPVAPGPTHVSLMSLNAARSARQGVWIEFGGDRWYSAGPAVSFDPSRFLPAGSYRGFPVYREKGDGDALYVATVRDGGLTPYKK